MFLDLEGLSVDQLIQKQIEIRERMGQARFMSQQVTDQLSNMLEQVTMQIQLQVARDKQESDREKLIAEGKDPDDDVLNIGEIE